MHDPNEGITPDGTIITGASRARVASAFEPVIDAAISATARHPDVSLYLYGSAATGVAVIPTSDVDLVSIGLSTAAASGASTALSARFAAISRGVDVGAAQPSHYEGDSDESYGNRVFLRHYCVYLAGPDRHSSLPAFAADAKAARGLNGDIARYATRWREDLLGGADPHPLSRHVARKTLLAVAGLVSINDHTWTTDRSSAALRWATLRPQLAEDLETLARWSTGDATGDQEAIRTMLDGAVNTIVAEFASTIGLWRTPA
ncbi:MAG: hypothetical protein GY788_21645 [bacterium]|nr:hypothetical protein [bacterium]